jgi:hypothetical protein
MPQQLCSPSEPTAKQTSYFGDTPLVGRGRVGEHMLALFPSSPLFSASQLYEARP